MNRRRLLREFALVTALAAAVAACSPAGSGDSGKSGGPLVIARTVDLEQLDPAAATAFGSVQTLQLIYDTLLHTDQNSRVVAGLAKTWETSPDGRTLTFHLRPGVKFHNGDPLTADAVVASLKRVQDEATASVVRSNLLAVSDITASGPDTVVIKLSKPDASVLDTLTLVGTAILDPADIKAGRVAKTANGTGPFKLTGRTQGQKTDLTANPSYYGGKPKISGVEFRVIPDENSILAGLRAHSFDAGVLTDPNVVAQVHGGGLKVATTPSLAYHALMLNGRRKPLDRLNVRQAIACAVDRKQVIDTAVAGQGTVTGPITSPGYGVPPTFGLPCTPGDAAAAKKRLGGGKVSLKMLVMSGGYASAPSEAQNLQAQLSKIGVSLSIDQQPTNVYVKRWTDADYDVALALNGGNSSPYLMYSRYFANGASLAKPAGLDSPEIAKLLAQTDVADAAQRSTAVAELQRAMLQQSPWVWLFTDNNVVAMQSGVKGLGIGADNSLRTLATATKG